MPIHTRQILRLLAIALLVAPLAACELAMANFRAEAREQWSQTFTLPENGRVELENTNGSIDVQPSSSPQVEVTAEKGAKAATDERAKEVLKQIEVSVEQAGDRLRLKSKYPKGLQMASAEIRYVLKVPGNVSVKVENTNGAIKLTGLPNGVDASTTNGGVRGTALKGSVRAATTNGGVDIDVDAVHADGIELNTTNGGVKLQLPGSAKADLSASCVNGSISTDNLSLDSSGDRSRRRVDARLNGGGPRVRLETVNGGVRIIGKYQDFKFAPGAHTWPRALRPLLDVALAGRRTRGALLVLPRKQPSAARQRRTSL
jgi:hypothetical protein